MSCELEPSIDFLRSVLSETGTDHDGVMSDSRTMATETFNGWFGTNYRPEEIVGWSSIKKWGLEVGLTEKDAEAIERKIWHSGDLLYKAKPLKGAVEFMRQAYDMGIEIPVISSRPSKLKETTLDWYQEYMPFIHPRNISVGMDDIDQDLTKVWMILKRKEVPLKLFLEDAPEHAKHILESTEASVVLVSNVGSLDQYLGTRLFRISGTNGRQPDLWPLYNAFFGKRE